jgi:hypothetical protein
MIYTLRKPAVVEIIIAESRVNYGGVDKSLDRRGRKQATATEDFDFRISYL